MELGTVWASAAMVLLGVEVGQTVCKDMVTGSFIIKCSVTKDSLNFYF